MKIISVILATLFGYFAFAQDPNNFNKFYLDDPEQPLMVINEGIIASVDVLKIVQPDNVLQLDIFKDTELSSKNLFPLDKKSNGIIQATLNVDLEVKTQAELNSFFGLDADNDIYVNGYLIEDKEKTISTSSIKEIEVREADGLILKTPSLNITIE